jgi:hypothetical protein
LTCTQLLFSVPYIIIMNIIKYKETIDNLLKELKYNEDDGEFYWVNSRQGRQLDKAAGTVNYKGYTQIKYNGKLFITSRLVWYLKTGEIPLHMIGYKDGNPRNTRWDNLRVMSNEDRTKNYRDSMETKPKEVKLTKPVKRATFTNAQVHEAVEEFIKNKKLVNGRYVE